MKYLLFICFVAMSFNSNAQTRKYMTTAEADSIYSKPPALVSKPFPDFKANAAGLHTESSDLKGKVVFVNFWFAACPPCMAEMEGLNKLYEKMKDKKEFVFLSFSSDSEESVAQTREKYNIKYPIFSIPKEECYRLNGRTGFPTSYVLDRNSIVRYGHLGGPIDSKKATDFVTEVFTAKIQEQLNSQ